MRGAAVVSECVTGGWLLVVLTACETRLVIGQACTRSSECTAPLACQIGRCRTEFALDRDCPLGTRSL